MEPAGVLRAVADALEEVWQREDGRGGYGCGGHKG